MGVTYRFLAVEDDASLVLAWFRSQPENVVETVVDRSVRFYFSKHGPLAESVKESPVVNCLLSHVRRGVLNVAGEVHFLATPISRFPEQAKLSRRFRNWLHQFPCVFSQSKDVVPQWNYYLEGSLRNFDSDIFALPQAMTSLQTGSYFVGQDDSNEFLDVLCRQLENREVQGITAE